MASIGDGRFAGKNRRYQDAFLRGTFLPSLRAFERPMAMACFRLFTLPPLPPGPLFAVPRLKRCISFFTSTPALGAYLRFAVLAMIRFSRWLRLRLLAAMLPSR